MEATYLPDYFRYEGKQTEKKDTVLRMYRNNFSIQQIECATGLSIDTVSKLIAEFSAKDDSAVGASSA